jgi:hypothetical protein
MSNEPQDMQKSSSPISEGPKSKSETILYIFVGVAVVLVFVLVLWMFGSSV